MGNPQLAATKQVPHRAFAAVRHDKVVDRASSMVQAAADKTCSGLSVSVSIGFAFYPEDGVDADHLIREADHRMYQEKKRHHSQLAKVSASASPGPIIGQEPALSEEFPAKEVMTSADDQ